VLLGISKRGDPWVRALVIHGARAVVSRVTGKDDPLSLWIQRLVATRGFNKAVVALANKIVRMAWVVIARGEAYQPRAAD
jgi:transposase